MSGACRFCSAPLRQSFLDLGMTPLSNAYIKPEQKNCMEPFYPLHAWVCSNCRLVQLEEYEPPETIFSGDYAYYSSYSSSWLTHVQEYVENVTQRFKINQSHLVIEIASNDGYLLQYFKQRNIPVLGVEPAANVAKEAEAKGIKTIVDFFGVRLASTLPRKGDLIVGNNVLAHVPDLNDFVAGIKVALGVNGVITLEFPHLLKMIQGRQFDTIYHEHFSYFSLFIVEQVFKKHNLRIFDVETLPTHGGSLRIYACHLDNKSHRKSASLSEMLAIENDFGLTGLEIYKEFSNLVYESKRNLLRLLINLKESGKSIVGYGAPAKGNTLLNYCGIKTDIIDYTVDKSAHKQGRYLPGTRIPVHDPEILSDTRPDYILILPWNLKEEIISQLSYTRQWGCQFVIPIPLVEVIQ